MYARVALRNILTEYCKSSKAIGPIIKGLIETNKELEVKWENTKSGILDKLSSFFKTPLLNIGFASPEPLPLLPDDRTLEGESTPNAPSEKAD
jgi:hypothetical protein